MRHADKHATSRTRSALRTACSVVLAASAVVALALPAQAAAPATSARTLALPTAVGPTVKPDTNNTGVPAGKVLKVHQGDLTITTSGTVIDGLDIRGFVRVKASNVTIKNSIVRGRPITSSMHLVQASSTGLVIQDSELNPTYRSPYISGIMGKSFTLKRVDIHHVVDQVHLTGGAVRVESSWLHDNLHYDNDPHHSDGTHDDSIQIKAGSGIVIVNNTIQHANNAGIMIAQDAGTISNVTIANNFADGGACTINVAEKGRGPILGLTIRENRFGRDTRHWNCAILSPTTTKITTASNYYTDGQPVSVKRG